MMKNVAKKLKSEIELRVKWNDVVIDIILAIITVVSIPGALFSIIDGFCNKRWEIALIVIVISILIGLLLFYFFKKKVKLIPPNEISESEYKREQKVNQINKVVFESIYKANSSKIREILRYTYGKVPEWNPINYRKNVLVYDVHEQIRSILISIEEVIINMDPERFNEKNVSVELVYCYPQDENMKAELPLNKEEIIGEHPWRLISSGDTSGNQQSVLEHLSQDTSFFTLVDCCGTVFKNNKTSKIEDYQLNLVKQRLNKINAGSFFVEDVRDWERSKNGVCNGTAIGTVINIRNDNPENIFIKAILTINTYGEPIFVQSSHDYKRDKFYLSESDYKDIFFNTILSTYTKLLETELAQMYIRHAIKDKHICAQTGRKLNAEKKEKCAGCASCGNCVFQPDEQTAL